MYEATVSVDGRKGLVLKCFASEDRAIKGKASYVVKSQEGKAIFEVKAEDSIALRTVLNSITKMLTVIEKTERIGRVAEQCEGNSRTQVRTNGKEGN